MNKYLIINFSLFLIFTFSASYAQPWTYNFGDQTGIHSSGFSTSFTPSPSSGTARVRVGNGGGSINMNNPGTSLGSETELEIVAATGTSTNKFGIYSWSSPSTYAYVRCKYRTTSSANGNLNFSLGASALGSDNNGYTGSYNNALVSFTITYSSGAISSVVRRSSGSNVTITNHGFVKDQDQVIEIFANNSNSNTTYHRGGTDYTLNSRTWDLWVDGEKKVNGGATAGTWAVGNNIEGFAFYAESSSSNSARIYIDDIEYSNNLPTSSNHYFLWDGVFSAVENWNTRTIPNSSATVTINANATINDTREISNITINSSKTVQIDPSGQLTVSGTLTNNGTLTLKSDATGTGSLIHSNSGVNATVERYIPAVSNWGTADDGWHLLSSPVASQSISGAWTPSGSGDDYDIYAWDETQKLWLNQKVGGNNITTFAQGTGYLVSYQQTKTQEFS
ncbi:MAG: hypothetical protein ACP5O2_12765, partial [Bacteroidales bacterium]